MKKELTIAAMWQGLIIGTLFVCNFLLSSVLGFNYAQYIFAVAIIFLLYYFTNNSRKEFLNGKISFTQAFFYMMQVSFYATLIAALAHYIFYQFISPDFLTGLVEQSIEILEQMNVEQVANSEMDVEALLYNTITPMNMTIAYFVVDVIYTFIPSIIIAIILNKTVTAETPQND